MSGYYKYTSCPCFPHSPDEMNSGLWRIYCVYFGCELDPDFAQAVRLFEQDVHAMISFLEDGKYFRHFSTSSMVQVIQYVLELHGNPPPHLVGTWKLAERVLSNEWDFEHYPLTTAYMLKNVPDDSCRWLTIALAYCSEDNVRRNELVLSRLQAGLQIDMQTAKTYAPSYLQACIELGDIRRLHEFLKETKIVLTRKLFWTARLCSKPDEVFACLWENHTKDIRNGCDLDLNLYPLDEDLMRKILVVAKRNGYDRARMRVFPMCGYNIKKTVYGLYVIC